MYVWIIAWAGSERESHALVVAWLTFLGHFFRVPCGQSPYFTWF